MKHEVTYLGTVRRVVGAKVYIEVCASLPSASPIICGRAYRIGQVGSFVRIPLGFLNLYGVVSLVGATEVTATSEQLPIVNGQRWIEVQLVGEAYANESFQRGVSIFPTIDDEAHIVTEEDLTIIYGVTAGTMVEIGSHVASDGLKAYIDLDKLVSRHCAVVGSTGCGKSNTIAAIMKALTAGEHPNARLIVIDPHGEYHAAFPESSRVFRINDAISPLMIPYWALSFDELAWFLYDRRVAGESTQDAIIRERIYEEKKAICGSLCAGQVPPDEITADSPIPFKLKELFYDLYEKEHATLRTKDDFTSIAFKLDSAGQELRGNMASLMLPQYQPPANGATPPFRSPRQAGLGGLLSKIYGRLKDRRFSFLLEPTGYDGTTKDLHDLVDEWLNHDRPITIFDFGGVPFEVMDLVVGVLVRILFEGSFWGRDLPGIGRQRPLMVVFEEAHAYLPRGANSQFVAGYAGRAVRRIFKEGRKYGIGALVVSQRPSELDDTILSQCGTFFALRLANSEDKGRVSATVPDSLTGLIEMLPALRTGEAIVVGEAMQVPSRIRLPLVEPRPNSTDPLISDRWAEVPQTTRPYNLAITGWRRQQLLSVEGGDNNG